HSSNDFCYLPAVRGRCRGYFPRYFFSSETGKCERFIYGGCGGNRNNFESAQECGSTCYPRE
uniref:PI-actitoxin-Axm2b n=1 Tax=Anthopleura aff. xanthogrammica TaxID=152178 RepID=VKT3_ANTAF|nr:RecName: Full=PI-actitoxin-Axm2b; Short=PI-AITX-Axm2b; AltName: Full=AXPI-III [Anthopleura aff. xanthogrammica]